MPKLTIYVPDALAAALREATMNVSAVCQRAILTELGEQGEALETDPMFLLARIENDLNLLRDKVVTDELAGLASRPAA